VGKSRGRWTMDRKGSSNSTKGRRIEAIKLFFKFNKFGFIYLGVTPIVALFLVVLDWIMCNLSGKPEMYKYVSACALTVACLIFGWGYAIKVFIGYKERITAYHTLRELYMGHNVIKKSMLWKLKEVPCSNEVVKELQKEFDFELETT
jgi:hypothetical protein